MELDSVLETVARSQSNLREIFLSEWNIAGAELVVRLHAMLIQRIWFSKQLLTVHLNKQSFEAVVAGLMTKSESHLMHLQQSDLE